jgi:hypothetical protein
MPPVERTGGGPGERTEGGSGECPEDGPGERPEDGPGDSTPDGPGDSTPDGPGERPGDGPRDGTGGHPGYRTPGDWGGVRPVLAHPLVNAVVKTVFRAFRELSHRYARAATSDGFFAALPDYSIADSRLADRGQLSHGKPDEMSAYFSSFTCPLPRLLPPA